MSTKIGSPPIENWDIDALIAFLRKLDLKFDDDDYDILRREKITGFDFTNMTKEEFERCGLKIGPSRRLAEISEALKSRSKCSFSYHNLKKVLEEYSSNKISLETYPLTDVDEEYNINKVLPGTYPPKDVGQELQQSEKEIKIFKSEQESTNNNNTSAVLSLSMKSVGTQTTNVSADSKTLTYLIQGLISRSIAYFPFDEAAFIGGTTEGICKISSVDPRLSSVSLYCEYEFGKSYYVNTLLGFMGYPIALKSPFSSLGKIITGLDPDKTKLVDNINYVIEFIELPDCAELVKSSRNTSASTTLTRTVATQTIPYIEDTKALTYIAKGIMFKSICWFAWDEQEAFCFGKKKGLLRLVSADPKLTGVTLTCNYQLSNRLLNFQGDIGYPMLVDCSYGSVKTILTQDKKKILDNFNYALTFLS